MITLVTDSTAYLTKEEADRLKLRVVPMHYTIAGNSYTEGFADENQNFVDKIAANPDLCATAQASVADFVGMFQAIVHQGGEVLCVVISSRLSGAYSSACIAAKAVDAEKVRVVDSRTTAGGLALLLKKAAKLIRQGYPLEDIVAQVKKQREKTGIAFSVEDMESLRKSGRLSIVRQSVGAILNIRPILCLEKDGGALHLRIPARRADGMRRCRRWRIGCRRMLWRSSLSPWGAPILRPLWRSASARVCRMRPFRGQPWGLSWPSISASTSLALRGRLNRTESWVFYRNRLYGKNVRNGLIEACVGRFCVYGGYEAGEYPTQVAARHPALGGNLKRQRFYASAPLPG